MGGKALNKYGVFTERKNTEEFLRIGKELQRRIEDDLPVSTAIVSCYHTKADHGDLDLLLKIDEGINILWREYIQKTFSPEAINSNGGVYSFDYKNFQIDFIPIPEAKWETAKIYYSYDPLGNIMGKTYHKFGLSYGWQGLHYKFRNFNGSNSQDIVLTNDARRIFEFGGYDYDRYLQGFEILEEIFNFCISGKYFDAEMFQMENLKSIDKKRNRKRGSYHLFLNYIKDNGINTHYEFEEEKDNYLITIDSAFPEAELLYKLHDLQVEDDFNKAVAEKFNGNVIMEWLPELKGKELGAAITKFKESWGEEYKDFISSATIESIKHAFMTIYNK